MIRRVLSSIFILLIALSLFQCARRGRPSGGPRDETPPVLVKAEPPNESIEFSGQSFKLYFDEYVQLKNIDQQLIVSPPLKYQVEISPSLRASKAIEVIIADTLQENTTYAFNFGQSIEDYNEGNPLPFFRYVFSTGSVLDSLSLKGTVKDAFMPEPESFISVMLYRRDSSYTDSAVYKKPPSYITSTMDSLKVFELKNLRAGTYEVIALKDNNNNNLFDPLVDQIGFLDQPVELPKDSFVSLKTFFEHPAFSLAFPKLESNNRISMGYFGTPEEIELNSLNKLNEEAEFRLLREGDKDTLNYWFKNLKADSLLLKVEEKASGFIDTLTIKLRAMDSDSLVLKSLSQKNKELTDPFFINATTPLEEVDPTKISIIDKDTLNIDFDAQINTIKNQLVLDFEKQLENRYSIYLLPGAVQDFYQNTNDSLNYSLSVKKLEYYGTLNLLLTRLTEKPIIIELLSEDLKLQRRLVHPKENNLRFEYLEPMTYYIRVILDADNNGKWDPGAYLTKRKAELVFYYQELIDVRSNWDIQQDLQLPF